MDISCLKYKSRIRDIFKRESYLRKFAQEHPGYFNPCGTMIFCGGQGSGKTLSAVKYTKALCKKYPKAILVTNVEIYSLPFNAKYKYDPVKQETTYYWLKDKKKIDLSEDRDQTIVIEYDGLDCLKFIENGYYGVIFLVDELHLELNSLESKNIDIDVITEISQQRKQRKHIIGTSQVYMRLAKPIREQIFDVIECGQFLFPWLQNNKILDTEQCEEVDGKLHTVIKKHLMWIHKIEDYTDYNTFAKMKRYRNEWQGRPKQDSIYNQNYNGYTNHRKKIKT